MMDMSNNNKNIIGENQEWGDQHSVSTNFHSSVPMTSVPMIEVNGDNFDDDWDAMSLNESVNLFPWSFNPIDTDFEEHLMDGQTMNLNYDDDNDFNMSALPNIPVFPDTMTINSELNLNSSFLN